MDEGIVFFLSFVDCFSNKGDYKFLKIFGYVLFVCVYLFIKIEDKEMKLYFVSLVSYELDFFDFDNN